MSVVSRLRAGNAEGRANGTFLERLRFILKNKHELVNPPALLHPARVDHELWSRDRVLYRPGVFELPARAVFVGALMLEQSPACLYHLQAQAVLLVVVRGAPLGLLEGRLWGSKEDDAFCTKSDGWHPVIAREYVRDIPDFLIGYRPAYYLEREGPASYLHMVEPTEEPTGWLLVEPASFPRKRLQLKTVFQAGDIVGPPPGAMLMSVDCARRKAASICTSIAHFLCELAVDLPPEGPSPALGPTPVMLPPTAIVPASSRPGLMTLAQLIDGDETNYGTGTSLSDTATAAKTLLASLGVVVERGDRSKSVEDLIETHSGMFGDLTVLIISLATGGGVLAAIRLVDVTRCVSLDIDSAQRVVRCAGVKCILVDTQESFSARVLEIGKPASRQDMQPRERRIDLEEICSSVEAAVAGAAAAAVERALIRFREEDARLSEVREESADILQRISRLRQKLQES